MGGLGSGNRCRFDKKTTTDKCHSLDVRDLHRGGLLQSGNWFRCSWSQAGKEAASIRGSASTETASSFRTATGAA